MRGALVVALALCACSKKPEPPAAPPPPPPPTLQLSSLGVQDVTPTDRRPVRLAEDTLRSALESALTAAGLVRGTDKSQWRVAVSARVVYGVALPDGIARQVRDGPAKVAWEVSLRLRPPGEAALGDFIEATGSVDHTGDAAALEAALTAQVRASAQTLAERIVATAESYAAPPETLIARLSDPRRDRRLGAATRLGMLRHRAAVPALIERLAKEDDATVRLRLVGALTELADPRATDALIALADPKDRELLRGVVDALSATGGQRADDFLDILSSHDAPDIREMVQTARARMERREAREKR